MSIDATTQATMMATQATTPRPQPGKPVTEAAALKVGRQFESMFLSEMFKPMFDTLPVDGMFGGGKGEEMFRSLLVDNYAKSVAEHGNGLGIAKVVAKSLLKAQEAIEARQ